VLADHGLSCRVNEATHDHGGLLDIVASRDDLLTPTVDVVDVGLSDHRLLHWSVMVSRPAPIYHTTTVRPCRLLDSDTFRDALSASDLCNPATWTHSDIDEMASQYDTVVNAIQDRLIAKRSVTCRRRPSEPWFDQECREAKSRVRRLEHAASRAAGTATPSTDTSAAAAKSSSMAEQRVYRGTFYSLSASASGTRK